MKQSIQSLKKYTTYMQYILISSIYNLLFYYSNV